MEYNLIQYYHLSILFFMYNNYMEYEHIFGGGKSSRNIILNII